MAQSSDDKEPPGPEARVRLDGILDGLGRTEILKERGEGRPQRFRLLSAILNQRLADRQLRSAPDAKLINWLDKALPRREVFEVLIESMVDASGVAGFQIDDAMKAFDQAALFRNAERARKARADRPDNSVRPGADNSGERGRMEL